MRVLLDENLPHQLRPLFADSIEVITVAYRGWNGKRMENSCEWLRRNLMPL